MRIPPSSLPPSPSRLWFAPRLRLRSTRPDLRLQRAGSRTELRLQRSRAFVLCAGSDLLCAGSVVLFADSVLWRPGALRCPDDHGPAACRRHDGSSPGSRCGTSDCSAAAAGRALQGTEAEGLVHCLGDFRPIDRFHGGYKRNRNGFARNSFAFEPVFTRARPSLSATGPKQPSNDLLNSRQAGKRRPIAGTVTEGLGSAEQLPAGWPGCRSTASPLAEVAVAPRRGTSALSRVECRPRWPLIQPSSNTGLG